MHMEAILADSSRALVGTEWAIPLLFTQIGINNFL